MTTQTPYEKALARKRPWTAVPVEAGPIEDSARDPLMRGLALRCLELPVGDFLRDGLSRDLPTTRGIREVLESNIQDEERHDQALNYVVAAHGVPQQFEDEAQEIRQEWLARPEHPIHVVSVLERAVFFMILPFNRKYGDIGIRTVSADISRDEQVHAAVHTAIADSLGLEPTPGLDALRVRTVEWMLQGFSERDFWRKVSDNLMYNRKAPELAFTQAARRPAFFETSNSNLPNYGRAPTT